jgi:glycosyltransferase involved in cell wall biosynthesis
MLDAVARHYGRPRTAAVVPNGTDPARFAPRAKEPFVLSAGRVWDEAKNVAAVDAVAGRLGWPVYVAGDARRPGGEEVRLRGARALGALSRVSLARWMGRAAIYTLPARYEPFGLSALEAALAGCALVLGDIPSLREVWGDDAALFVPPDDHEALAAALAALIADGPHRTALAARGRLRAAEYHADRTAAGYLGLYERLAGDHDGRHVVADAARERSPDVHPARGLAPHVARPRPSLAS